jgi:hypothetical protein
MFRKPVSKKRPAKKPTLLRTLGVDDDDDDDDEVERNAMRTGMDGAGPFLDEDDDGDGGGTSYAALLHKKKQKKQRKFLSNSNNRPAGGGGLLVASNGPAGLGARPILHLGGLLDG